jgi:RHS repeat-associated protein
MGAVKLPARMRVPHIIAAIIVALLTTSISAPAPSSAVAETRIHLPWVAQIIAEYIAPDSEGEEPKLFSIVDSDGNEVPVVSMEGSLGGRVWQAELVGFLEEGDTFTFKVSDIEDMSGSLLENPQSFPFVAPHPSERLLLYEANEPLVKNGKSIEAWNTLAVIDMPENVAVVLDAPIYEEDLSADAVIVKRDDQAIPGSVSVVNPSQNRGKSDSEDLPPLPEYPFVVLWTPDNPDVFIADAYAPFTYTVTVKLYETTSKANQANAPPEDILAQHTGLNSLVWEVPQDNPILSVSQVANDRFRHGRPYVEVVHNWIKLYDHRARWQHPETFRFLQPDPLGAIDSANPYQAFGFDGYNLTDPSGELIGLAITTAVITYYTFKGMTDEIERSTEIDPHADMLEAGITGGARGLVVGGVASSFGRFGLGLGLGLRLGGFATMATSGAFAGAGGIFAEDAIDVGVLHRREHFSSPMTYVKGAAIGGALGGAGYGVGRLGAGILSRLPRVQASLNRSVTSNSADGGRWVTTSSRSGGQTWLSAEEASIYRSIDWLRGVRGFKGMRIRNLEFGIGHKTRTGIGLSSRLRIGTKTYGIDIHTIRSHAIWRYIPRFHFHYNNPGIFGRSHIGPLRLLRAMRARGLGVKDMLKPLPERGFKHTEKWKALQDASY